jgi:hypothetical protein
MPRLSLIWIVCTALLATPALAAQVYKWVDEHGLVHYGDKPPPRNKGSQLLEEGAGSVSVVPGIPKDELDRMRRQSEQQRVQRLERELEDLRAQAAARADAVPEVIYTESHVPVYGHPIYGYPAHGHWRGPHRGGVRPPGLRPEHPIVEPRPEARPRRGARSRP